MSGTGTSHRGRVERIEAGHHLQHQRAVADGVRHGTDVVQAVAERHTAFFAHPPKRRLDPTDAAQRRRVADGAAGVGAQAAQHQIGRDGRAGARARATGDTASDPTDSWGCGSRCPGQDGPIAYSARPVLPNMIAPASRNLRTTVASRPLAPVRVEHAAVGRRRRIAGGDDVLDAERDAVERPAVGAAASSASAWRAAASAVLTGDHDERGHRVLGCFGSPKLFFGQRNRGDPSCTQPLRGFGDCRRQFGHTCSVIPQRGARALRIRPRCRYPSSPKSSCRPVRALAWTLRPQSPPSDSDAAPIPRPGRACLLAQAHTTLAPSTAHATV